MPILIGEFMLSFALMKNNSTQSKVIRIVSGGQTGADRGGLDAAIELGMPYTGWCPKGRLAEDKVIPSKYILRESTSAYYVKRTEQNVDDSTATVIFFLGKLTGGSKKTEQFAVKHGRPVLLVNMNDGADVAVTTVVDWLKSLQDPQIVLNVAGMRGSKAPELQGVVCHVVVQAIRQLSS